MSSMRRFITRGVYALASLAMLATILGAGRKFPK